MLLFLATPPAFVSNSNTIAQVENGEAAERGEQGESNDLRADLRGISKIEDAAEVTSEGEKTGAAANAACRQAVAQWPAARSSLMQNGASSVALARVDLAIENLQDTIAKGADLRRSANEVTGALAPLFNKAGDKVPSAVHYLDYLSRSVTLDVQSNDWSRAERDSRAITSTWAGLSAQVRARRGGPAAAAHFAQTYKEIARAVQARNASATLNGAKDAGSAVDQLEKIF